MARSRSPCDTPTSPSGDPQMSGMDGPAFLRHASLSGLGRSPAGEVDPIRARSTLMRSSAWASISGDLGSYGQPGTPWLLQRRVARPAKTETEVAELPLRGDVRGP